MVAFSVKGLASGHAVHGGDRVGEAEVGLAGLDRLHVGDAGAGQHLHLDAFLVHDVGDRAAERIPGTALGTGHQPDLLGLGAGGDCDEGCRDDGGPGGVDGHDDLTPLRSTT
ncbi:MAG: hypothetical protein R3E48_14525 [Burkholderiaceae bacterium]